MARKNMIVTLQPPGLILPEAPYRLGFKHGREQGWIDGTYQQWEVQTALIRVLVPWAIIGGAIASGPNSPQMRQAVETAYTDLWAGLAGVDLLLARFPALSDQIGEQLKTVRAFMALVRTWLKDQTDASHRAAAAFIVESSSLQNAILRAPLRGRPGGLEAVRARILTACQERRERVTETWNETAGALPDELDTEAREWLTNRYGTIKRRTKFLRNLSRNLG